MLLSEKLLENAKAAIDEARQYANEINRLSQRVQELELSKAEEAAKRQQVEEELQHLKAENAQAAIDEARQYADEISRLSQRGQELELSLTEMAHGKAEEAAKRQQVEEELQHLKAENTSLADTLSKETSRATSLHHEVERLRQKLVGSKADEGNATPHSEERVARLEVEVDKLRRSLDNLWRIESRQDAGADEEDRPVKRWVTWRSMAWLCATALGGWLTAIYMGLLK